jgi:hypothetical protein
MNSATINGASLFSGVRVTPQNRGIQPECSCNIENMIAPPGFKPCGPEAGPDQSKMAMLNIYELLPQNKSILQTLRRFKWS